MRNHLSTAKSPIGMQGPTVKTYFAKKMNIDPTQIVNIAVTPCTAKKYEIKREEMCDAGKYLGIDNMRDMDYVITTRELAKWAKEENIDFTSLKDSKFDSLMGEASGAGVIFGNSGGVMEAALRTAYEIMTGESAPINLLTYTPVRGLDDVKEASVDMNGITVNIAVIFGTKNASQFIEKMKTADKKYHFVEVMTCPGGCIGGGGQPKDTKYQGDLLRAKRIAGLYNRDQSMNLRKSHDNPEIQQLYKDFYQEPMSDLAENMLHTTYIDRSKELGK